MSSQNRRLVQGHVSIEDDAPGVLDEEIFAAMHQLRLVSDMSMVSMSLLTKMRNLKSRTDF